MPETFKDWIPQGNALTDDEILFVIQSATELGFTRFRITGGEPLVRTGIEHLISKITSNRSVESLQMTTNGTRLPLLCRPLFQAGLKRLNISLDALDPEIYQKITRGNIEPVIEGILMAKSIEYESIKINAVLMRGKNENQIFPLLDFAAKHDIAIRFIELMPVSMTEMLNEKNFLPVMEVKKMIEQSDTLIPDHIHRGYGPARYYRLQKRNVTVGFIGAITDEHFCESCNKMRLTSDGKLRPCLGNHLETNLMPAIRPKLDQVLLRELFLQTLGVKPMEHIFKDNYQPDRIMTAIGG